MKTTDDSSINHLLCIPGDSSFVRFASGIFNKDKLNNSSFAKSAKFFPNFFQLLYFQPSCVAVVSRQKNRQVVGSGVKAIVKAVGQYQSNCPNVNWSLRLIYDMDRKIVTIFAALEFRSYLDYHPWFIPNDIPDECAGSYKSCIDGHKVCNTHLRNIMKQN